MTAESVMTRIIGVAIVIFFVWLVKVLIWWYRGAKTKDYKFWYAIGMLYCIIAIIVILRATFF
jgi:hypothetical protein